MWDDNNEEFKDMCRVCLVRKLILIDIFTLSSSMGVLIADALMACAPVQITREDGTPSLICESCYSELVRAHQFQKLVFESEKIMRQHFRKFNDNVAEYYPEDSDGNTDDSYFADSFCEIKLEVLPLPFAGNDYNQNQGNVDSNDNHNDTTNRGKSDDSHSNEEIVDESTVNTPVEKNNGVKFDASRSNEEIVDELTASTPVEKNKKDSEPATEVKPSIVETNEKEKVIIENTKVESVPDVETKSDKSEASSTIGDTDKTVHRCEVCNDQVGLDCTCRNTSQGSEAKRDQTCKKCDTCFENIDKLNKHKCNGSKSFRCNICNKNFKKKYDLTIHKRSHASVKPYQCDICDSRFSSWRNSNVHKRRHNGEKLYKCDICKKNFTDNSNLESHKRAHKGEKPFNCEFCDKSFCRISTLNRHKSTHSSEKPYKCKICKKGFSQLHYFNVHKSRHETETTKKKQSVT